ncbi:hypothetical protein BKA56DRAFT_638437 [Ilyonectria sp. MPI-CAGE-AT-0026]|nr:hypothetical protein BKA56DRAFT_638437 [Ilyonectria sp. MPI-CAGE-AT-0026]
MAGPSTANITSTTKATAVFTQPSNAGRKRRSCLMCSKRKVKCDKQKPCHNCAKAGSECIFPSIAANRNQAGMAPELVDMLHRLEKVVQTLEPREKEKLENILPSHHYPDGDRNRDRLQTQPSGPSHALEDGAAKAGHETSRQSSSVREENLNRSPELQKAKAPSTFSSQGESPGMIVRDHGRETYVRRWFWDDGGTEVSSGSVTDEDCPDVQEAQDDVPNASTEWFQGRTSNFEADFQHPAPKSNILDILIIQRLQLWSIYKERVEPLTKLLHLPSLEQAVMGLRPLSSADGMQCILLAVYYGAITSLTEEECIAIFESGQAQVLARLREELERMFSSAMLLHTGDIRPLQALVLYLAFLRHHEPRLSWNLSGLAVRLAQNFGLHREGSLFGLSKFKMEMRRRLWWQIAILDAPSAEDYSGEYNMLEMSSFDTQPPRNLDDVQLHPTMIEYPPETQGITEMTFTLARCQITSMYRCMADARRLCGNTGKSYAELTSQERVDWIEACQSDFSERFLQNYSPTNALHWVTVILTRMLFHKVRLHGCNPLQDAGAMSEATRERLFPVAVEVIELNYKLRTDARTRPWLWLFSSYTQWHAFSLVLVWLQMDPFCRSSRKAWEAVEKAIILRWEHPPSLLNGRKPQQWRSIIKLLEKARSARQETLNKRARRGSRHGNDLRRASASSKIANAHASSSMTNLDNQPMPQQQYFQPHIQHEQVSRVSGTSPSGPPTPPVATTDVSSSEMDFNAMMPSPRTLQNQIEMPDFSIDVIPDPMAHSDLSMMDGDFSADFRGVDDFSFLDDML